MDCRNARRQFDPFLLGELENERKTEMISHLDTCTSCQQQWQEFQQFISLVKGSLRTVAPPQAMAPVSLTTVSRPMNRVIRAAAMATVSVLLLILAALPLGLTPLPGSLPVTSGIPSRSVVSLPNSQSVSPVQTQGSWYVAFH